MAGLGYLEVAEDLSYKGPIDKFIPEGLKAVLRELTGLEAGDTCFLSPTRRREPAFMRERSAMNWEKSWG